MIRKKLPHIFVGSILYTSTAAYLIVNCEVYGCLAELDVHFESDNSTILSPYKVKGKYASLTTKIGMQADASNGASKVILGASGFNVLVTSSVILFSISHVAANIEPSCVSLVGVDTVPALFKANISFKFLWP